MNLNHKKIFFLLLYAISLKVKAETNVFFSPKGGCEKAVVDLISNSTAKIDIAVYSINNTQILAALSKAKERGIQIRILTDHLQAAVNSKTTLDLQKQKFNLRLHSVGKIMHDKFAVVDGVKAINGSFNWTNAGEKLNVENCLITDEPETVTKFSTEFSEHLWLVNTSAKSDVLFEKIKKKYLKRIMASEAKNKN